MTNITTSVLTYGSKVKTDVAICVTMGVKNGVFESCDILYFLQLCTLHWCITCLRDHMVLPMVTTIVDIYMTMSTLMSDTWPQKFYTHFLGQKAAKHSKKNFSRNVEKKKKIPPQSSHT